MFEQHITLSICVNHRQVPSFSPAVHIGLGVSPWKYVNFPTWTNSTAGGPCLQRDVGDRKVQISKTKGKCICVAAVFKVSRKIRTVVPAFDGVMSPFVYLKSVRIYCPKNPHSSCAGSGRPTGRQTSGHVAKSRTT